MWSIDNGSSIWAWKDSWVPKLGSLCSYVPTHVNLNLDYPLSDWVLDNGSWNLDFLRIWLLEYVIKLIGSVSPLHLAGGEDRII